MSVSPRLLEAQILWLRQQGYTFLSLEETLKIVQGQRPMPAKAVAITLDDGFQETLTHALPILQRNQVPATVFVVPRYLDPTESPPWLKRFAPFGRLLTWEELRTLVSDHLVSVGSHGWSHRRLSELSREDQAVEIGQSKSSLETKLGRPVTWFAYPYGASGTFSSQTIACLERAGFAASCTNVMGTNRVGDSPWTLKRTRIGWEDRLWRFRLKMAGAYDWVDRWPRQLIKKGAWHLFLVKAAVAR